MVPTGTSAQRDTGWTRATARRRASRCQLVGGMLMALFASSCETLEFYRQAAAGQLSIVRERRPVAELTQPAAADEALRGRLSFVDRVTRYARDDLALEPGRRYTSYVRIDAPYVLWNVFAAPEFATAATQWCYPIVGCAAYRGYFKRRDAERFARRQLVTRHDVTVGGVAAYSTLGWFDDPLLSTFIDWPDDELAGLIFHELAHARVFVAGDSAFDEAFASFVERQGVAQWLRSSDGGANVVEVERRWRTADRFVEYLLHWRDRLQRLYDQPYNDAARRLLKTELLATMEGCYRANRDRLGDQDAFFRGGLNNARFVPLATYGERVAGFAALFARAGGSWPAFYASVERLAHLDAGARAAELERLGAEHRAAHARADSDRIVCEALAY